MSGFEIAGLVLGVVGLVPIFKEGYVMVKQYRHKRKLKFLVSNDSTSTLKHTLGDSSTALTTRYDSLYSLYGTKFATGDSISREELSKIIILLQGEIIVALRIALTGGTLQNPDHLNSVAAKSREGAIAVLAQLAQRLAIASPILSNPGAPKKLAGFSWRRSLVKDYPRKQLESTPRIQELDVPKDDDSDPSDTGRAQVQPNGVSSRRRDYKQGKGSDNYCSSSDEAKGSCSKKQTSSLAPPAESPYKMRKSLFREKSTPKMAPQTPTQHKVAIYDAKPETPKNQQQYLNSSPPNITISQMIPQSDKKDLQPTFWDKISKASTAKAPPVPLTQKAATRKQAVLDSSSDDEEYEAATSDTGKISRKKSAFQIRPNKPVYPVTRKQVTLDISSDDEEYSVTIPSTKSKPSKTKKPQPIKRTAASGYNKYIDSDDEEDIKYPNVNSLLPRFSYSLFTSSPKIS